MGAGMSADVESAAPQLARLIPRHPGMADPEFPVPPRHHVAANPLADEEKRRRQRQALENRRRVLEVVAVSVVEGDRQVALERVAALEPIDEAAQGDDPEVAAEEIAVALKRRAADRQAVGIRAVVHSVVHPMERDDGRRLPEQNRMQPRRKQQVSEQCLGGTSHRVPPANTGSSDFTACEMCS